MDIMPIDVRAELIWDHMNSHIRKHMSKKDISNITNIPIKDINNRVMTLVRNRAEENGMKIPTAMGSGLYVLTDAGEDVINPMMISAGTGVSHIKVAEDHSKFIREHLNEFPYQERKWLRSALTAMKDNAQAAQSNWELIKDSYKGFERERMERARAKKAELEKRMAIKDAVRAKNKVKRALKTVGIEEK